jgi:hypothetical protein
MTSQPIQQPSASTSTRLRERTAAIRFLIAGTVLLGVTVMNLFVLVQDWSTATSSDFIVEHALPLAGVVIGLVLVITGIVRFVRR